MGVAGYLHEVCKYGILYNMSTVTIPKNEYQNLVFQAKAYQKIASDFASQITERPIESIISNFRNTGKYNKDFLSDLHDGLTDLRKSKAWKSK